MFAQSIFPSVVGAAEKALQAAWWDGARTGAFAAGILVLAIVFGMSKLKG